jgi:uncharacterized protein YqhQ
VTDKQDKLRLGGMALRNGLLVHGPAHWAAAVRREDGTIAVASGSKPRLRGRAAGAVPGLRGVLRLSEAVAVIPLVKRGLPEARLPFHDATVLAAMAATATAGAILRRRTRGFGGEAAVAALSLAPSLVALRGGELAAYHGVEHKAIGAYEQDADAREATKEHDRCGSHLVAPLLAANLAGTALLRHAVERPSPLAGAAVQLASIGAAVEVFAWYESHGETALARAVRRPGHELQRLIGTREPTEEQLEVGRAALAEILRVEQ